MDNKPLLKVEKLLVSSRKEEDTISILKGVDFELYSGEILGIVGESGSGKTMSALSIMGLLPNGVQVDGGLVQLGTSPDNLLNASADQLRKIRGLRIGMIFQNPMSALNPVIRCGAQISEVLRFHLGKSKSQASQEAKSWMEKLGLKEIERIYQSFPHELSGGQQQRIMLAMAMCCQPEILIADEPTTALDATVQRKILDLLSWTREQFKTAILLISHDLSLVAEIADRVLVMRHGEILESASAKSIFDRPQHAYTKGLINCRPKIGLYQYRLPTLEHPEPILKNPNPPHLDQIQDKKPLLKVEQLVVDYFSKGLFRTKKKRAVDQVSFEIFKGETLGLVGESGSGKTTLGKTILGLKEASSGMITFDEQNQGEIPKPKAFHQKVQMIFQNPMEALNPRLPIGSAILEPIRIHELVKGKNNQVEKVVELLEQVGLSPDDYTKYPQAFSGGQRQRVGIARALAMNPEFIVCDEIVSALDVSIQAQILNLLKDLQEQYQLTYLFIAHDLSVVQFMSQKILVMQEGKIVEEGKTKAIYENPQHDYTKTLLAAIPAALKY